VSSWLALAFLALYLLTASARIDSGDGQTMYQVTDSMLRERGFTVSAVASEQDLIGPWGKLIPHGELISNTFGAYGVDGRYYAKYGPGQSFAVVPFYLLGKLAHTIYPAWSEGFWEQVGATLLVPVVSALTVALVARTAQLFFGEATALKVAVLYGLATPAWPYAKSFFSEPLLGGLMLLSGYAAMRARRGSRAGWWVLSGAALGLAALVKPTALLIAPAIVAFLLITCRPIRWLEWLGSLAVALALLAWYNALRFGNPLATGYGTVGWETPLWLGVYGLVFSAGKGLVWFAPLVALGVAALPAFIRRAPAEGALVTSVACLFIGAHSLYAAWEGGGSWGPRLIVPVVAWLVLPLGVILDRKPRAIWQEWGLAVVIAVSIVVQILGLSLGYARHLQAIYVESHSTEEYYERVQFSWPDSPILSQVSELRAAIGNVRRAETRTELQMLVKRTLAAARSDDPYYDAWAEAVGLLAFNVPDFWFVYWGFLGAPEGWLAGIATVFVGVAVMAVFLLRRAVVGCP